MSFLKKGTPQPIKVASGLCEVCGKEHSTCLVDGKMVCDKCRENLSVSQ
jgi:hypothetical protein